MATAPQPDEPQPQPAAEPAEPLPVTDLWAVVAASTVPALVLFFLGSDWPARMCGLIFIAGIGIRYCQVRRTCRPTTATASMGAWLLPLIAAVYVVCTVGVSGVLLALLWLPLLGLFLGFLAGNLFDAAFFLWACLDRLRNGLSRPAVPKSLSERIDEASTPLESPPSFYLQRRFGVRGLLIVVTWAAVLMGCLRALGASPVTFFLVLTFVAGVLGVQVLLFGGRKPQAASMWAGALLLPAEVLVVSLLNYHRGYSLVPLEGFALGCICLVPAGIVLGAIVGPTCGTIYALSERLLLSISGGLPAIRLEPIAEADADVLLAWVRGPKFCRRWAGGQLTFPLDRNQLLERFATAQGEKPIRLIFKAVDTPSGNMVGYVELGRIDYLYRQARLELPLVEPTASERGRLGVLLLRKVAEKAFRELGLRDISIFSGTDRSELALCCMQAWARAFEFFPVRNQAEGLWKGRLRQRNR